jgi:Uma2 family endonuclease
MNSLAKDDKRLLYKNLKVTEYWIIDLQNIQIIAFAIADAGSKRIAQS